MRKVADSEIAAFRPLCKSLARKFNGLGRAEYDDLEQEGLIAVWLMLANGYYPNSIDIKNRILNWVNVCRRQGFSGEE